MKYFRIPDVTIMRLSMYSRYLDRLQKAGVTVTSSQDIADNTGSTSAQVRKDLAYFGGFGVRGVGYTVKSLYEILSGILGVDRDWNLIVIGAGRLGMALSLYQGFNRRGFTNVGIFDVDPRKVGRKIQGRPILHTDRLEAVCEEHSPDIALITVPAEAAQGVADRLVGCGVRSILNFAPTVLQVPPPVRVRNVDFTVNLEFLTYSMVSDFLE